MVGRIGFSIGRRVRRLTIIATALVFGAIGAHSLNPRELYHEMYPLEPVKQDAFQICDQADPTFIRAVGSEREACYNKMPHVMAVAMGRVKPVGAVSMDALTDPSREAALLLTLASMPPQQPITTPRSFSNIAWLHALAPACDAKPEQPALTYTAPNGLPPTPGGGRAAALDGVDRGSLPALPRPMQPGSVQRQPAPVIALTPAAPAPSGRADMGDKVARTAPLPAPDIGDEAPPAIVPLAPSTSCGGA
jgi:hypothetical protein